MKSDEQKRAGRWIASALLPPMLFILFDIVKRWDHVRHWSGQEGSFYAACAMGSVAYWSGLFLIASRTVGVPAWIARVLLVLSAGFAVGGQLYTFSRYHVYLDAQAVLWGTSMLPSVGQQLWSDRWSFLITLLPPIAFVAIWPRAIGRLAPPDARKLWAPYVLVLAGLGLQIALPPRLGAEQGQPPDALYFSAMGRLAHAKWTHNQDVEGLRPSGRTPRPVKPIARKASRSVVFMVTESVRASATCMDLNEPCTKTPFTNKLLPNRHVIREMRALDSTTAISLAVLFSGIRPESSRAEIHSAPLIWEYAHAAGYEGAYFTSQNLLFGNSGRWLEGIPVKKLVSATMIDHEASMEIGADDGKLMNVALEGIASLKAPYFSVVHLSNTHFPYLFDENDQPAIREAKEPASELPAHYQDSVYYQDRRVADFITKLRALPGGKDTVVVFISDHGEQVNERGQIGHTFTMYDEELHVPAWIDAPPGVLTNAERMGLAKAESARVTQLDVLPTLLDLLGVLDAPQVAEHRARLGGTSLLRGGTPETEARSLSNCTELWSCAFRNWGAMRGSKKVFASQWDHGWKCFDLATDPHELDPQPETACGDLVEIAKKRGQPF